MDTATTLDLPPGFSAIVLREYREAFEHAKQVAPEHGAGTLVWVRRLDTIEFAVVLEPEEPLRLARRAIYAGMNAAADALAVHCPPEKPIQFEWPDTVLLDRGILGGARIGWPEATRDDDVPRWLVLGIMLRTVVPLLAKKEEHAHALDIRFDQGTSLELEGFEMLDGAALISSFARHLMVYVDQWQTEGFDGVGQHFVKRLTAWPHLFCDIDDDGDLIVRSKGADGSAERRSLSTALLTPKWLDPQTGEPRL